MKAIRGATTVERDSSEHIKESVKELLIAMKEKNSLTPENIICIMFSSTADIRSFYPAKAAREAGFFSCALYSSLEPEINGSLPLCIRVMMLAEIEESPKHVYLKDAVRLRKDLTANINIAIDGPAGSGKSTISGIVASRLNILHLDTGAMYRACALACLKHGVDCTNAECVKDLMQNVDISVMYEKGAQRTLLDGQDVSSEIRSPEISMLASTVSSHECIRSLMTEKQRQIAMENSCVLDGRDIGTNVLPNAKYKFFLTATPEIRAERRAKENLSKGIRQTIDEVLSDIKRRDEQDKTRKIAPLIKADDAIEVDTSNMEIEEVADFLLNKIQERI